MPRTLIRRSRLVQSHDARCYTALVARPQSTIVAWSQYALLRSVAGFVHCFAVEQNLHTAAELGSMFLRVFPRRKQRAVENLRRSFPDWTDEQIEDVTERCVRHMFQLLLVDVLATPRLINSSTWPRYIRLGKIGNALDYFQPGRPLLLVTGHCGNWELVGYFLSILGYDMAALARPLDNTFINRWVMELREVRGMRILTKWGASSVLPRMMQRGERVGVIADQNAGVGGMFVPFFGRLASTYKSIGLLAMRYQVPILAGIARRVRDRLEYVLDVEDIIEPEHWADQPDPLFYITARYTRAIETVVRKSPEQYLWIHRRWRSRPRHERENKPFPDRLREQLRALPWMSDEQLQAIVDDSERLRADRHGA